MSRGFTLVEVLVALCLIGAAGVVASGAAQVALASSAAAHAEAAGLLAATAKLEELIATEPAARAPGNDEIEVGGVAVARVWRLRGDDPARGISRLEVTARWSHPALTLLTMAAVAP